MRILWVDDEIEGFKPHILFLQKEGIEVTPVDRPSDALNELNSGSFDLILLDYRMPEMDGLTLLREMRKVAPHIPIVLVTMVSDKDVMEESVAEDVFDYLLKPIQPSQILAIVNRLRANEIKQKILGKKIFTYYQKLQELQEDAFGWREKARIFAESFLELGKDETIESELRAENQKFARWVVRNYPRLLQDEEIPMSHNILRRYVLPLLDEDFKIAFFLLDNFRLDQFLELVRNLSPTLKIRERLYFALLPTATPFARNAIFAGLLPIEIERRHSGWLMDNRHEHLLLHELMQDAGYSWASMWLYKIHTAHEMREIEPHGKDFEGYVVNFIDLISHLRHEVDVLKDLIADGPSFIKWCKFMLDECNFVKKLESFIDEGYVVFLTADHGWVEGHVPIMVKGGMELTRGLRYKFGDSLRIAGKDAVMLTELEKYGLPRRRNMGRLALATSYSYFVYPSDPHRFGKIYRGGIYHGGITLEEMIVPLIEIRG